MKCSILDNDFSRDTDKLINPQVLLETALKHPNGKQAQNILWAIIDKYLGKNLINTHELKNSELIAANKERALIALEHLSRVPEAFYFNIHNNLGQPQYITNACDLILQKPEVLESLVTGIDSAIDTSVNSQLNEVLQSEKITFDVIRMMNSTPSFAGTSGDKTLETSRAISTIFQELSRRIDNPQEFSLEMKIPAQLRIDINNLIGVAKRKLFERLTKDNQLPTTGRMEFFKELITFRNSPGIDLEILEYMQKYQEVNDGAYESALSVIQHRES